MMSKNKKYNSIIADIFLNNKIIIDKIFNNKILICDF